MEEEVRNCGRDLKLSHDELANIITKFKMVSSPIVKIESSNDKDFLGESVYRRRDTSL